MEIEQVLEMMNFYWFQCPIFHHTKLEFPSAKKEEKSIIYRAQKNLQIRSHSDRCIAVDINAESPRSVIMKPKLQRNIPFDQKEGAAAEVPLAGREKEEKLMRERGMSRSLSALEFQELKGFMDLGFVFDGEESNPDLASIIPGLQKWKKTNGGGGGEAEISRPYLSEAWGDLNKRREDENILMRIPNVKNEIHMKDHIKIWAHVVASTVR